jgi:hypothetical protein
MSSLGWLATSGSEDQARFRCNYAAAVPQGSCEPTLFAFCFAANIWVRCCSGQKTDKNQTQLCQEFAARESSRFWLT